MCVCVCVCVIVRLCVCVCVCVFMVKENTDSSRGKSERRLVIPYNVRIPKIRISTRQSDLLRLHRIVVRIDSWSYGSQYPDGHLVRSVGPIGERETETAVILIEHGLLCPSFSQDLLSGQRNHNNFVT